MTSGTLSLDEAARLLNVSCAYLVGLLDAGVLHAEGDGDARRVQHDALLAFRADRDAQRREGLRELTQLTEEFGGYDKEHAG